MPEPPNNIPFQITHRSLTDGEARRLHEELKTTPNILGYTVREMRRLSDVYVAEINHALAGVCFSVDLPGGWTEIAVLYVLPEFRGGGLGKALFEAAWDRAEQRRRHLYILSRNPQVIAWMHERGMTVNGRLWQAPPAIHWYTQWYMLSLHRTRETVRKWKAIRDGPHLMQGIKRSTHPGSFLATPPEAGGEGGSKP